MFQNSVLPSVSMDLTQNLTGTLPRIGIGQGLARLERILPLPRTFREYVAWLTVMVGITCLALLQVWATLQISAAQSQAGALRAQYRLIEEENAELLWTISHFTTLERVQREAATMGYVPTLQRRYVQPQRFAGQGSATVPPRETVAPQSHAPALPAAEVPAEVPAQDVPLAQPRLPVMSGPALASPQGGIGQDWLDRWRVLSAEWGAAARGLGASWAEALARIDLSNYLWIDRPDR